MNCLGIDTSNYTTSAAVFTGTTGVNKSRLLDVDPGQLGLRQSDALFAHTKRLPEIVDALMRESGGVSLEAIGVSTRPRAVEGSYMPCFLAGWSQARTLGAVLGLPVYEVSHQQGHIAAALWSAGRMELMDRPHLAWHLSGGTTELLLVEPDGVNVRVVRIGGTSDISAGQLIDRTGKLLGLPFPSGKAMDQLSRGAAAGKGFPVKCRDMVFSLSGVENQVQQLSVRGAAPEEVAAFALQSVIGAVLKATEQALRIHKDLTVVFSGGVSSNSALRAAAEGLDAVFCPPQFATDNAMGPAVLAWRMEHR